MQKKTAACLAGICITLSLLLCSCSSEQYTVSFDQTTAGTVYEQQTVKSGKTATAPGEPQKDGYTFIGWYQDAGLTQPWNIAADKVKSDLTLYAGWDKNTGDTISAGGSDKDFSKLRTPGSQETAYEYTAFFQPEMDGVSQPYVGDTMPYYENGVYYIYYLKEAGDSYNHSIYLATTTDFVTYQEYDDVVLEASRSGGQDGWIGTGSMIKVDGKYYFFYTGHGDGNILEYAEKIMVAVGSSPTSFEKKTGWDITPPSELGQKNDFRDPQAYLDPDTGNIILTVTASHQGVWCNTSPSGRTGLDASGAVYGAGPSGSGVCHQQLYHRACIPPPYAPGGSGERGVKIISLPRCFPESLIST